MPVTGAERVNVFNRRVLGAVDFSSRILDLLESGMTRTTKSLTTGSDPEADAGTWFEPVTVSDGTGVANLSFGDMHGTDGTGQIMAAESGTSRTTDIPFPDVAAVTYYMAARVAEVPEGIVIGADGSGVLEYDRHQFEIGHRAEPTVVAVVGSTLVFTLGNHALHASDNFTGRTAIVFKKVPVAPTAPAAIETVTAILQTATSTGLLGQSTPSTTASDYEVVLFGPTITRSSSVQTAARWAFIGTVIGGGSPRVFDTSIQPSVVPLNELSGMFDDVLAKGWTTLPTVTNGGTTITIGSTGVVFTNGRLLATPTGKVFSGLPAAGDVFIYYSVIAGNFTLTTSWDTANAGTNVPVYWAFTAASTVVSAARIGRRVAQFPEALRMTLSDDPTHSGAFRTLPEALAAGRAAMKGTTLTASGLTIEVLGIVDVAATINEVEYFDLFGVTFQGRGVNTSGFSWSFIGNSLFEVPTGATLASWSFRDLVFRVNGVYAAAAGVFASVGTGAINELSIDGCYLDGNGLLSGFGGGTGRIPYLCYFAGSGTISGVSVESSRIRSVDGVIRAPTGSAGINKLRLYDVEHNQTAVTHITTPCFVIDESTIGAEDWRIRDCKGKAIGGTVIRANGLIEAWIVDNSFVCNVDSHVVDIGNASFNLTRRIFCHDNHIEQTVTGASTTDMIRIRATDNGGQPAGIFIHSNNMIGDTTAATLSRGISLDSGSAVDLTGIVIFGNAITDTAIGIDLANQIRQAVIFGNMLDAETNGIRGQNTTGSNILMGNWIDLDTAGTGIVLDGGATSADAWIVVGNLIAAGTGISNGISVDTAGTVIVGNLIAAATTGIPLAVTRDEVVISGNRIVGGSVFNTHGAGLVSGVWSGNFMETGLTATGFGLAISGNFLGSDLTLTGEGMAASGNLVAGTIKITGDDQVIAGNQLAVTDWDAGASDSVVFTGNRVTGTFALRGNDQVVSGNILADFQDTNAADARFVVVGNHIRETASMIVNHDDGAIVGNRFGGNVTLSASSANLAAAANRISGTFTDSGVGNTVSGANDV